ncbi:MAG: VTT domain-containing protein [Terricaulis sp.]
MTAEAGRSTRVAIIALALMLFVIAPFLVWGGEIESWAELHMAAAQSNQALAALVFGLLVGDIFLPIPSSLVIVGGTIALGPELTTSIAAAAMSMGSIIGYAVARWAGVARCRTWLGDRDFDALAAHANSYWPLIVIVLRPVPVLAEASILAAGALGAPAGPVLLASVLANIAVAAMYAFLGGLVHDSASFTGVALLVAAAPAAFWLAARWALSLRRPRPLKRTRM